MAYENDERASRPFGHSVAETILNATSLKIAILGVLFWVVAIAFEVLSVFGIWAALLAIWGTALIAVGLFVYAFIWWSYQ